MKSEELEQSLRSEFESYLKDVVAKMRTDVDEFQKHIESEFDKQRSHISDAFQSFSSRFDALPEFDGGFRETVLEHLRLARDEGAQITAAAMAEAEELEKATEPAAADLSEIREALDDISAKDSQSTLLKSLITHAAKYTPRGAFFIIKNDHFAGWKVFGKEAGEAETAIREIHFPLTSDSILSKSVRSLKTVEGSFGTFADDATFLDPLHFGQPDRMYAIPLIARGRGVAVLYCDYGHEGVAVNTDALEMLVKVAGLTVELLASSRAVHAETPHAAPSQFAETQAEVHDHVPADAEPAAADTQAAETESYQFDHGQPSQDYTVDTHDLGSQEADVSVQSDSDIHDFQQPDQVQEEATAPAREAQPVAEHIPEAVPEGSSFDFRSQFDTAPEYVPNEPGSYADTADVAHTPGEFVAEPVTEKFAELEHSAFPTNEYSPAAENESAFQGSDVGSSLDLAHSESLHDDAHDSTAGAMVFDETIAHPVSDTFLAPEASFESHPVEAPEALFGTQEPVDHESTEPASTPSFSEAEDVSPSTAPAQSFEAPAASFEVPQSNGSFGTGTAPVADRPAVKPTGTRLSDRNVDLPIEVSDDERRLHNDARRFARLLVSEIKLYNEKKVQEGRESNDLYERLREAIDRSREMYDKRVQPPVAAKFDYFHYELVNSLAEGAEEKLGRSYKGASV